MPAFHRPERTEDPEADTAWRGYGLLAAAWLAVLGSGAAGAWIAYHGGPAERPVVRAVLHAGSLPAATQPLQAGSAKQVGPATGSETADAPAPAAGQPGLTDPSARQLTARPDRPATDVETPASAQAPAAVRTDSPTSVQIASRTPGPEASAPAPPAVPRTSGDPAAPTPGAAAEALGRYSVQVGAFRERENALARAARLRAAGYEVRIVHAFATHSRLYMVRLGQFDARPAAMAYARQLARDVAVETWPVRN